MTNIVRNITLTASSSASYHQADGILCTSVKIHEGREGNHSRSASYNPPLHVGFTGRCTSDKYSLPQDVCMTFTTRHALLPLNFFTLNTIINQPAAASDTGTKCRKERHVKPIELCLENYTRG